MRSAVTWFSILTMAAAVACSLPPTPPPPKPPTPESWTAAHAMPTFGALAACSQSPDRPICLLRLASIADGGRALFYDLDFVDHPELIAAAGVSQAGVAQAIAPGFPLARQALYVEADRAVYLALKREREAGPDTAFQPVAALDRDGRTFKNLMDETRSTATLRIAADYALWAAAWHPDLKLAGRKPSTALISLALADWEASLASIPADQLRYPFTVRFLATAYMTIGDATGAESAFRLDRRAGLYPQYDRAAILHQWDMALKIACRPGPDPLNPDSGSTISLAYELTIAAELAARPDIAVRAAECGLKRVWRVSNDSSAILFLPQLARLAPRLTQSWTQRFDAASRGGFPRVDNRLEAALAGWDALRRRDRADALIALWRPVARNSARPGSATAALTISSYLAEAGRPREARLFKHATLWLETTFILRHGLGLGGVKALLAEVPHEDQDKVLMECVDAAEREGAGLSLAETCLTMRAASFDNGELQHQDLGTLFLYLAISAQRHGDAAMRDRAWAAAIKRDPALPIRAEDCRLLIQLAKGMLRADHRL